LSGAEVRALPVGDPLRARALYLELERRYLVWDAFVGGARRVDLHPLVLDASLHEDAVRTAEDAWKLVAHFAERAHADPDELARYGLTPDAAALARAARRGGDAASLVRVDLLLTESGHFRACEVNVDSPGGFNEAAGLPALARAAGFRGADEPGAPLTALVDRLCSLSADGGGGPIGLVHSTAYAEDLQIAALVRRRLRARGHEGLLLPATALRAEGGRLHARGRVLSALYRYFPAEYMEGFANVPGVVRCLEEGAVRSLTSFAFYVAQSKFVYALAWEKKAELPTPLRRAVENVFPYTVDVATMTSEKLVRERARWVLKRAFGRVGDEVLVGELVDDASWASLVDEVLLLRANGERWIAQRRVVQRALATPWGPRLVTLGAYLCDGRFVGYFARLSEKPRTSLPAIDRQSPVNAGRA